MPRTQLRQRQFELKQIQDEAGMNKSKDYNSDWNKALLGFTKSSSLLFANLSYSFVTKL